MNHGVPRDGEQRIGAAIRAARESGGPALAAFLTAGYPSRDGFVDLLRDVAAVADVVEVGVPFSDPMADGVTIQESSRVALAGGVTLPWIFDAIEEAAVAAPVVLMSYLNPLLRPGIAPLVERAVRAGIAGFVVPDLPIEESDLLGPALADSGLGLVQMVTPLTPPERRLRIARATRGFLYAVTRAGTTGASGARIADDGILPDRVAGYLRDLRRASNRPVMAGFGIRRQAQVAALAPHVDGVIVGSALVDCIARGDDPVAFLCGLRAAAPTKGLTR